MVAMGQKLPIYKAQELKNPFGMCRAIADPPQSFFMNQSRA
jgi:hypothetical protein